MARAAARPRPPRAPRARAEARRRGRARRQLVVAAVAAVLGVAALVWIGSSPASPLSSDAPAAFASEHARGQATAPVVIEEWADFQCPACGTFARSTEQQLVATYVARGQVRFVFRHFAFLGNESQWAAEAAECANEHGRFWEYHDRLFAAQAGENRGAFSRANLVKIGDGLGLGPAFASCLDSGRYDERVRADTATGRAKGVTATPTLFVNGQKIQGAISFDQLKSIVDPLLGK